LYQNEANEKSTKTDPNDKRNLASSSYLKDKTSQHYKKQKTARSNIIYCCLLNGGIFLLSKYIFEYLVLPIVFLAFKFVAETDRETQSELWSWIQYLLSWIFSTLWILPIFLLSRIVNIFFFQEIADSSFRGRTQQLNSVSKLVADYFFSLFVQAVFLVQTMSLTYLPINYLNQILAIVHLSLLYSMYSFEYKWFNMGWELHKRLHFIEFNWPYFVGFGLPLAILTSFLDDFVLKGSVFSLLFPLYIISSNVVKPKSGLCDISIPIFQPSVTISNALLKICLFLWRQNSYLLNRFHLNN